MLNRTPRLAAALMSATLLAGLAISSVSAAPASAGRGPGHGPGLDLRLAAVRAATQRFEDPAEAVNAGYELPPAPAPLHECISSFDDTGSMGFHYINGSLLDTTVDPLKPEALVYAPDSQGTLRLVALEYVVFQAPWIAEHGSKMPTLFHQMFMSTGEPNRFDIPAFFSLHLWLYKDNPAGLFAPFNPSVSCDQGGQAAVPNRRSDPASTAALAFDCAIDRSRPISNRPV